MTNIIRLIQTPPRVRLVVMGAVLVAGALLAGCGRIEAPAATLVVSMVTDPSPPRVGKVVMRLHLQHPDRAAVRGASVQLEGNMNHAGMRPVLAGMKESGPGDYEGSLEFTMGGDWFVLITGTLDDGRVIDEKVEFKGVSGP